MRKFVVTLFLIPLISALASCSSPEHSGYHGYLFYGKGSYLMQFSLRDALALELLDRIAELER